MVANVHSPKNFNPANYTYVGYVYIGTNEEADAALNDCWSQEHQPAWEALDSNPKFHPITRYTSSLKGTGRRTSWQCDHCGKVFKYGAVYKHSSGEVIFVGHICAGEAFGHNSRVAYDYAKLQKRVRAAQERLKMQRKAETFLKERPALEADLKFRDKHHIIDDIASKLYKYGSISDKQVAFINRLATEIQEREVKRQERLKQGLKSTHVGTVGERIQVVATIERLTSYTKPKYSSYDSDKGVLTKLVDEDGNHFVYFNSITTKEFHAVDGQGSTSEPSFACTNRGDKLRFSATIKKHSEYQGIKQTLIQRASKAVLLARGLNPQKEW